MPGELRYAPAGVMDAHAAVVRALDEEATVDDVLRAVASGLCGLLGARRCSVYLRDPDSGIFRGRVGYAREDIDPHVRRLVAGVEADGFTREMLRTGRPVEIQDARMDPRPVRSTMRDWNVRSMLGVPVHDGGDALALAFVDDEATPRRFDDAARTAAAQFAGLAAGIVRQAVAADAQRERLRLVLRQNRVLRRAAAVDEALTAAAADGLAGVTAALATQTGRPVLVRDGAGRVIAGDLALDRDADLRGEDPVRIVDPGGRRRHRLLVADVAGGAQLVLAETPVAFTSLDRHAARRGAALLGLALAAERRAVAAGHDSRAALCSDLLRGDRDAEWLHARGRAIGLDLHAPHVVCVVAPGEAGFDAGRVAAGLEGHAAAVTALDGAVACLLAVGEDPDLRALAAGVVAAAPAGCVAAVSEPFTTAARAAGAHEEAAATLRCVRGLAQADGPRVVLAADLGVARLLLSAADPSAVAAFAERALGPLLAADTAPELLETVDAFLAGSRSVRVAATTLGVHENTIRYRLGRVQEVTGLDVGTGSDDQLTAQLALRVLQLQGRCPWPAAATEPERPALALVS